MNASTSGFQVCKISKLVKSISSTTPSCKSPSYLESRRYDFCELGVPLKPSKVGNLSSSLKSESNAFIKLSGICARLNAVLEIHPALVCPTNSCRTRVPKPIAKRMLSIITK